MFPTPDDRRAPTLDALTARLTRDSRRLRDAVDACDGLLSDHLVEALRARTQLGFGVMPTSHGTFAVRG